MDRNRQKWTETEINKQKQNRKGHKQTQTDTNRHKQTETDRADSGQRKKTIKKIVREGDKQGREGKGTNRQQATITQTSQLLD